MSSAVLSPDPSPCALCGSAECACHAALAELDARARALVRDGFRAARERRLHHAARRLGEAVRLTGGDARSRAVLGLCRLALGDAMGARSAWRGVESDDCAAWLRALEDGELRRAFRAYDAALASARAGDHAAALGALEQALEIVPGLVPAGRLRGLVLLAQGAHHAARAAWEAHLDACRDDPELRRLLAASADAPDGASADASAGAAGDADLPTPVLATAAPVPAREDGARRRARSGRALAFAAGAGTTAAVAALAVLVIARQDAPSTASTVLPVDAPATTAFSPSPESSTPAAATHPATSTAPAAPATPAAPVPTPVATPTTAASSGGWASYRVGRDAHARGDWAGAIPALEASVAAGAGRFYHDDALYLLARSLARAGRADEARRAAGRLGAEHPASPFHNRVVRAIAATGAEPAR